VHRLGATGWLKLNDDAPVNGKSKGYYSRITLRSPLYLGGVPDGGVVARVTGTRRGLVGCVKSLKIDGAPYDFRQEPHGHALYGIDVGDCGGGACKRSNCVNGATCVPNSPDR
jgi:hypothetical protein